MRPFRDHVNGNELAVNPECVDAAASGFGLLYGPEA